MFEVRELGKHFGVTRALEAVTLDFTPGQVTALLGENGAGKSTLLSILAGVTPPGAGGVYGDGRRLILRTPRDARANGIKVIPQEPDIVGGLTVAENIYLGMLPNTARVFRRQAAFESADELIARCGLDQYVRSRDPAARLTAAGRQLVEILRALVSQPRLVAFDEPTSALGHDEVRHLRRIIDDMRRTGVAVIYVSHRRAEIEDVADRVAVLRDGRLVGKHEGAQVSFATLIREMAGREMREVMVHQSRVKDSEPLLVAKDMCTRKLKGVSFEVRPGEILGIAGLGGSGRSEVARALVGDRPLEGGHVEVDGRTVTQSGPKSPRESGIGYVPEDRHNEGLVMTRNVRENVALASLGNLRRMRIVNRAKERELVSGLIADLSIRCASQDSPITSLSGGNQQKVVLARSMALTPRVWVLDEPTKGIDIATKEAFYRAIEGFAESGAGIVLISSELPELALLCDRALVLRRGEIVAELQRAELTEERLVAAMFGEVQTVSVA